MYDNWCGKILYLKQIIKAKNDFPMCLQWKASYLPTIKTTLIVQQLYLLQKKKKCIDCV